jgi:hypothetical protein
MSQSWPNLKYYPRICMEILGNTTNILTITHTPVRDTKLGPSKQETRVLPALPQQLSVLLLEIVVDLTSFSTGLNTM